TTETVTVNVVITPVDDPVTFGGNTSGTGLEDGGAITGTLTAADAADGMGTPSFTVVGQPSRGTATIDAATGQWRYTPIADGYGADNFLVRVTDDRGNTATQAITVAVVSVADIAHDSATTTEGVPLTVSVLANDSFENAARAVAGVSQPGRGSVQLLDAAAGTVLYTPEAGFVGVDTYTYTVESAGGFETATVTVVVGDVTPPAPPSLRLDPASDSGSSSGDARTQDETPTIRVRLEGQGLQAPEPGDTLTLFVDGRVEATVVLTAADIAAGEVSITAATLALGEHRFTAQVTDQSGLPSPLSTPLDVLVDRVAPLLAGASIDRDVLVIVYTEEGSGLDLATPAPGDFEILGDGERIPVQSVTVDPTTRTVRLVLTGAVSHGEIVLASYTPGTQRVIDVAGNPAVALTRIVVRNDTVAPPRLDAPQPPAPIDVVITPVTIPDPQPSAEDRWIVKDNLLGGGLQESAPPPANLGQQPFILPSLVPLNALPAAAPAPAAPGSLVLGSVTGTPFSVRPDILESLDNGFPAVRDNALGGILPTIGTGATTGTGTGEGALLAVLNGIPTLAATPNGLSYTVPRDAFVHTDGKAVVKLEARLAGGEPLPSWLSFDGVSGLFNGQPPPGEPMPTLQVEVVARDNNGREARTNFAVVGSSGAAPTLDSTDRGFPVARVSSVELLGVTRPTAGTHALVPFQPIREVRLSGPQTFDYRIPSDAFAHTNPGAVVRLQASLANGDPLPAWLTFDPVAGRFSGTPPSEFAGVLDIRVVARDAQGLEAASRFSVTLDRSTAAPAERPGLQPTEVRTPEGERVQEPAQEPVPSGETEGETGDAQPDDKPAAQPERQGKADANADRLKVKRAAPSFADQLRSVREGGPGKASHDLLARAFAARGEQQDKEANANKERGPGHRPA
ncbi:MAG TPA: Ig-like domain-containing protein, partial [Ramlibacter sp.]|nr:Ig-like domain-containing protein [Ramlibacter sp.]